MKYPILIVAILLFSCRKDYKVENYQVEKETSKPYTFFNEGIKKLPAFEPGKVLVELNDNSNKRVLSKGFKHIHTKAMQKAGSNGFYKMSVSNVDSAISALRKDPNVKRVEKNWSVQTQEITDPYYNPTQLWGAFAINQSSAYSHGNFGRESVVVQIMDEPPFVCQEDLKGQFYINQSELNGQPGVDDDQNGYIDDVNGWNFVINSPMIFMSTQLSHGSHVSGTIGAQINGKGIVGVSPHVTMLATPFLGFGGGYIDNAILAVDYGTTMKQLHPDCNISHSSNSWGGGGASQFFLDALNRAKAQDIGFICAAGNNGANNDVADFYPANYSKVNNYVRSIVASTGDNSKASFSNYGMSTSLAAPGTWILSCLSTQAYGEKSGTSMACPQVSGGAALVRAVHPAWTFSQIMDSIEANVTKVDALTGLTKSGGILNLNANIFFGSTPEVTPARECIETPIDDIPPSIPQNFHVYDWGIDHFGKLYFGIDFLPSTDNVAVAGYIVYLEYPTWDWGVPGRIAISGMPVQIYDMCIYAYDIAGNHSDTSRHYVLNPFEGGDEQPPTLNGTPTTSNVTVSSITFNHAAASDNVGVESYTINFRPVGGNWLQRTSTNLSETFSGLPSNTTYEFNYTARDFAGNPSQPSATIQATTLQDTPPPAYSITVTTTAQQIAPLTAKVSWTTQTNGNISSIRVERKKGSGSYQIVGSPQVSETSFIDTVPNPGWYAYKVTITLIQGLSGSDESNQIQIKRR